VAPINNGKVVSGQKEEAMPNLNIRESLERAIRIFQERPEAAQRKAAPATATLVDGLQCQITGPTGEKIISDMPRELGGGAAGSHPGWFLRAALASCTATAIAMRAALLGIQLKTLEVTVESRSDLRGSFGMDDSIPRGMLSLRTHVKIGGEGAKTEQLRELAEWGDAHGIVSCTIRRPPTPSLEIEVV
jgi:uncharacterized OsmC-like protein